MQNNYVLVKMMNYGAICPMVANGSRGRWLNAGDLVMCKSKDDVFDIKRLAVCVSDSFTADPEKMKELFPGEEIGTIRSQLVEYEIEMPDTEETADEHRDDSESPE